MHKYNAAIAFQKRTYRLNTNDSDKLEEMRKDTKYRLHDGYIKNFINRCVCSETQQYYQKYTAADQKLTMLPLHRNGDGVTQEF